MTELISQAKNSFEKIKMDILCKRLQIYVNSKCHAFISGLWILDFFFFFFFNPAFFFFFFFYSYQKAVRERVCEYFEWIFVCETRAKFLNAI